MEDANDALSSLAKKAGSFFGFGGKKEEAKEETKEEAKEKNYSDCSPEEKKILKLVRNPLERDELIRLSGLTSSEANTTLAVLELKGLIEEFMGEIHLA